MTDETAKLTFLSQGHAPRMVRLGAEHSLVQPLGTNFKVCRHCSKAGREELKTPPHPTIKAAQAAQDRSHTLYVWVVSRKPQAHGGRVQCFGVQLNALLKVVQNIRTIILIVRKSPND